MRSHGCITEIGEKLYKTIWSVFEDAFLKRKFAWIFFRIGIKQPKWKELTDLDSARSFCEEVSRYFVGKKISFSFFTESYPPLGCASFAYFFCTKRNAKRSHFPTSRKKTSRFNLIYSPNFFFSVRSEMRNAHIFPRLERKRIRTAHPTHHPGRYFSRYYCIVASWNFYNIYLVPTAKRKVLLPI